MFNPKKLSNEQRAKLAERGGAGGPCQVCSCSEFTSGEPETVCANCGHDVEQHS